jgi:5-methyltetrahydrofolate--homocysteine methyltransferase
MTSAIMNPLHDEDMHAIMGANGLNGVDANCLTWIRKFREPVPAAAQAGDGSPAAPDNDADARRREREERRRRRG